MSIFGSVVRIVVSVVEKLGPAIPILLGYIKTNTSKGDREGLNNAFGVLGAIGVKFVDLAEMGKHAIAEDSPGGTAITGNEYQAFAEKAWGLVEDIEQELLKLK